MNEKAAEEEKEAGDARYRYDAIHTEAYYRVYWNFRAIMCIAFSMVYYAQQESWDEGQWEIVGRLFDQIALHLTTSDCTLLADRGLTCLQLIRLCEKQKWHDVFRIKNEERFRRKFRHYYHNWEVVAFTMGIERWSIGKIDAIKDFYVLVACGSPRFSKKPIAICAPKTSVGSRHNSPIASPFRIETNACFSRFAFDDRFINVEHSFCRGERLAPHQLLSRAPTNEI